MNTGAIAGIVIGVIIVVALLALAVTLVRRSQLQRRRELAREQWQEAEVHNARADRREAEVAERQARAAREQATAREQAAQAYGDRRAAVQRHATASRLDPDQPDQPGHAEGPTPGARSGVASTGGTAGEDGEAGRPRGLGRLTRFGRRGTGAADTDGPGRQPGDAPPKHAADTAGRGEVGGPA